MECETTHNEKEEHRRGKGKGNFHKAQFFSSNPQYFSMYVYTERLKHCEFLCATMDE